MTLLPYSAGYIHININQDMVSWLIPVMSSNLFEDLLLAFPRIAMDNLFNHRVSITSALPSDIFKLLKPSLTVAPMS